MYAPLDILMITGWVDEIRSRYLANLPYVFIKNKLGPLYIGQHMDIKSPSQSLNNSMKFLGMKNYHLDIKQAY